MSVSDDVKNAELGRKATALFGTIETRTRDMSVPDSAKMVTTAVGAWVYLQAEPMAKEDAEEFVEQVLLSIRDGYSQLRSSDKPN